MFTTYLWFSATYLQSNIGIYFYRHNDFAKKITIACFGFVAGLILATFTDYLETHD